MHPPNTLTMERITPHGFEHEVRSSLRTAHDFDTHQLDTVRGLYDRALVEMKQHELRREHFDEALKHMEEHPDWKGLSEKKREAVKSVFRKHLGIKEDLTPQ